MNLPSEFLDYMIQYQAQNAPPTKTKTPNVFNVREFGAAGDGVLLDAAKIQAALSAVPAGGIVHFPAGTYLLETPLTIATNDVLITGDHATLKLAPTASWTRSSNGQGHILVTGSGVTIDGLYLDGNTANLSPDATNNFGVYGGAERLTVRNCYITNLNSGGSNVNAGIIANTATNYFEAHNNRIFSCGGGAIFCQGHHSVISNNIISGLNDVGIVFNSTNCVAGTATGNTAYSVPGQCAFGIENGASECTIAGNTIQSCFGALDLNDAGYAGAQVAGSIFVGNIVIDCDKGASSQTQSVGVFVRTSHTRDIKIIGNVFSGLTVYGTTDAFIEISTSTEGLEISDNTFEGKAQAIPACVFVQGSTTQTRPIIQGNTLRSTSSVTKLSRGIWLGASSTYTNAVIARNIFENITNHAIFFDTGVSYTGELRDNKGLSTMQLYQASPWGTFDAAHTINPHVLTNTSGTPPGRSVWYAAAAPAAGTWGVGDRVWNYQPAAGVTPGWVCTVGGTPGTWKSLAPVGGTSTQTPGAVTVVNIAHGLGIVPQHFDAQPSNTNARGAPAFMLTADATNVILTFASALTAATSYSWVWTAG